MQLAMLKDTMLYRAVDKISGKPLSQTGNIRVCILLCHNKK